MPSCFLPTNWNDANASLALSSRPATNTTYNTAIMSGFMPSGWTPPSGAPYGYSGGAINFPRFLETWNTKSCTYYGSMVELFESKVFTGEWDTGKSMRRQNAAGTSTPSLALRRRPEASTP